jgi:predicted TIM-barrel fold metal-dependent hydrolase
MFASNLPVSSLSVQLDRLIQAVLTALPGATQFDIDALFAGTARRVYHA